MRTTSLSVIAMLLAPASTTKLSGSSAESSTCMSQTSEELAQHDAQTVKISNHLSITYTAHDNGCYKDAGNRDLPNLINNNGDPKKCFEKALAGGYKYVGLQYGTECWAGNSMGKYGKSADSQCQMNCPKDGSRKCGGSWNQEIFRMPKAPALAQHDVENGNDGPSQTKELTPHVTATFKAHSFGCYNDKGSRDLPNLINNNGDPNLCFMKAMEGGYKYVGLQYGTECWAGNSYGKYGKSADSQCQMNCPKDGSRKCGGSWNQEIFRMPTASGLAQHDVEDGNDGDKQTIDIDAHTSITVTPHSFGCYNDKGNRDLPNLINNDGDPKKCFEKALKGGYKYVGLQYGTECWAGNSYGKYGKSSDSQCQMSCPKDRSRKCGGSWNQQIFRMPKQE